MDQHAQPVRARQRTAPAVQPGANPEPVIVKRYFFNETNGDLIDTDGSVPANPADPNEGTFAEIDEETFNRIAAEYDAAELGEGAAETTIESLPTAEAPADAHVEAAIRYWYHPESGSLWTTEDGSDPRLGSDGNATADGALVEEITAERYAEINAEYDRLDAEAAAAETPAEPAAAALPPVEMTGAAPVTTPPAQGFKAEAGTCFVRRVAYGTSHEELDEIQVPIFATAPARVRVGGGATLNVGGMEYVRVDVQVELPCYPEASEIERAYGYALGFVEARLAEEIAKTDGSLVAGEDQPLVHDNTNGAQRNIAV